MEKVRITKSTTSLFFLIFFLVFCFTLSPVPAASQGKPIEIKFGHIMPPMAHGAKFGFEPWARNIEKATNGKVKFTIYPAQSLFKARDSLRSIETGLADMGQFPLGYFTGRFNLIEVITLPFIISNPTSVSATKILYKLWDEFPEIQKEFTKMKILALQPNDPYYFMTKDRPIRNMNDLQGLKLRAIGKYPAIAMKSLKVSPVMIPGPEIYEAGSKGVIDGGLIFHTLVYDLKLYEIWHYWTDAPIYTQNAVVAMNLDKWNSLPADVRKNIEKVMYDEAIKLGKEGFDGSKPKALAAAKKSGKKFERVELDKGEFQRMKDKIGRPIWDQWVQDMEKKGLPGQKVLDRTLELVKQY